jgi:chemotaxis protein methyltransferase CheR
MALNEAGWFQRAPIVICGSDASEAAIQRARAGVYRERSFRSLPPELRARYFRKTPEGEQIDPELHGRVRWTTGNLANEAEVAELAQASVVFCRNVFIYFSEGAIRNTVQMFARRMMSPGYLFLGAPESLLRISTSFQLEEVQGAFVYVKP